MAATATRQITHTYSGDVTGTETFNAGSNAASPASVQIITLAAGANTITAPTGGSTLAGVTIVPPASNTQALTLKGIAGDTGILIHKTDPTSIALDSSVTTFVINAAAQVVGVRLFWT